MTSWRDTDPRNVCGCGKRKSPESARCQTCHMRRVHRARRLKPYVRQLVERYLLGIPLYLGPGEDMTGDEFVAAVAEVIGHSL